MAVANVGLRHSNPSVVTQHTHRLNPALASRYHIRRASLLLGSLSLAATSLNCAKSHPPGDVTAERLAAADSAPENWYLLGRDAHQNYFSPLGAINATNVGRLGFAWSYDL